MAKEWALMHFTEEKKKSYTERIYIPQTAFGFDFLFYLLTTFFS